MLIANCLDQNTRREAWFYDRFRVLQDLYDGLIADLPSAHETPFPEYLRQVLAARLWKPGAFARRSGLKQVHGYLAGHLPRGTVENWKRGEKVLLLPPGTFTNHPAISRLQRPTNRQLRADLKGKSTGSKLVENRRQALARRNPNNHVFHPPHLWHKNDISGAYALVKLRGLRTQLPPIGPLLLGTPLKLARYRGPGELLRQIGSFFAHLLNDGLAAKGDEMLPFLANANAVISYAYDHRFVCGTKFFNGSVRRFLRFALGLLDAGKGWMPRQRCYAKVGVQKSLTAVVGGDWTRYCAMNHGKIERFLKLVRTQNNRVGQSRSNNPVSDLEALALVQVADIGEVWRSLIRYLRKRAEEELDQAMRLAAWRDLAAFALGIATSLRLGNIAMLDLVEPDSDTSYLSDAYVQFQPDGGLKVFVAQGKFKNDGSPFLKDGMNVDFADTKGEFSLPKIMAEYCNVHRLSILKLQGQVTKALFPVVATRNSEKTMQFSSRISGPALAERFKAASHLALKDIGLVLHYHLIRHINAAWIIQKGICASGRFLNLHGKRTARISYDKSVPFARNQANAQMLLETIRPVNFATVADMLRAAKGQLLTSPSSPS